MPTPLSQAFVRIRPEGSTFKPETEKIINSVDGTKAGSKIGDDIGKGAKKTLGSSFKSAFAGAFSGLLGAEALQKGVEGFKGLIDAGKEANKTDALTQQVIKSTGGAANVTKGHFDDLTDSISKKTGIDEDAVKSGGRLLLTFTGIRNEVGKGNDIFDQATSTVQDMSTALGQDSKTSAIQLGKALNDPIKGVSALQRVGVSFTGSQKDQIAAMVKSGNTIGAQKIILGELSKEFGGAAEASTTNSQKLGASADVLREHLGQQLIPVISAVSGFLLAMAGFLSRNFNVIAPLVGIIGALALGIWAINAAAKAYAATQEALNLILSANPIGLIILAIAALVIGLVIAYKKSQTFRDIVNAAFHDISAVVGAVVSFITGHWKLLFAILTGPIGLAVLWITGHFGGIVSFFKSLPGKIGSVIGAVTGAITAPFRAAFNAIAGVWNDTVGTLSFKIPSWVPKIGGDGFSMPKIPTFANGVMDFAGGLARVGERGPETVVLPAGSSVIPHNRGASGGRGPLVHADTIQVIGGSPDEVANRLDWELRQRGM